MKKTKQQDCVAYNGGVWLSKRAISELLTLSEKSKLLPRFSGVEANRKVCEKLRSLKKLITENNKMAENPMEIPDIAPMYDAVTDFVKKHQGERGYILTDDVLSDNNDTIWCFLYDETNFEAIEAQVKAVRVDRKGNLQAMCDDSKVTYTEESVTEPVPARENLFGVWRNVWDDDNLYRIPTLFALAQTISQYV